MLHSILQEDTTTTAPNSEPASRPRDIPRLARCARQILETLKAVQLRVHRKDRYRPPQHGLFRLHERWSGRAGRCRLPWRFRLYNQIREDLLLIDTIHVSNMCLCLILFPPAAAYADCDVADCSSLRAFRDFPCSGAARLSWAASYSAL